MVSPKTIVILSGITCILTLTSVGLTGSHAVSRTYVKYKASGVVVRTMASITEGCPPAVKVETEDDNTLTIISCPYRPVTKAIAFISLISLQFLLILVCWKLKNRVKSIIILIFAIIDFPLLLVAGILMITDMVSGKKELSSMSNYSYQPFEFVINVLFVFFGMMCGAAATYFAYTNRPPTHPSQPNTSMSVTKPHWSEGESYSKPYPRANVSTFRDYQGGSGPISHDTSTGSLHPNHRNTSTSPNGRGGQAYQPQNDQYGGHGNRRNISYEENPQDRPRQQSNINYDGNQQTNNGYDQNGSSYGNTPQRAQNSSIETPNANQNNSNHNRIQNNYPNNLRAGPQNRGNRNDYLGSNQSQMEPNKNNNNGNISYGRSPDNRSYANNGSGQNKFNSAMNRMAAMRGGANAFENGSNNRGYLNYGNESNYQGNPKSYDESPLDNNFDYPPNNRGRAQANNQLNYEEQQYQEEGNYQRANRRNTHVSQINGNNISSNNSGMGRPAPSQDYGGY